jgi:hypothetical protein
MSLDPMIITALVELAKVGIQGVFTQLRLAGLTDAEIEQFFKDQKIYFDAHPPETLPDV